jgi:hypothetical protein
MRHSYRCHASPDSLDRSYPERSRERYRVDSVDLLDTARCPCCRFPLVTRMGRDGPYFHCHCRRFSSVRPDLKSLLNMS